MEDYRAASVVEGLRKTQKWLVHLSRSTCLAFGDVRTRGVTQGMTRGSDQEVYKTSLVESGWVRGCLGTLRVGSGRVRRSSILTGQGRVALSRSDPREVI